MGVLGAAKANPTGGTVASGTATITAPNAKTVEIDQATRIVIINWDSFNILKRETTKFVQPDASSLAVNRIGGADPSVILGRLLANGKVVLINANGIAFGRSARVNVGSLIATTSDAADADLASGTATFDQAGNANAQIVNKGKITAAAGGVVGLIAPAVRNDGVIAARLGNVTLGASNVFTVDFTGDGLVSFPVDGNVVAAAIGKNGKPVEALVVNNGRISSGTVVLSARAAADLVTNVISMRGVIAATAAQQVGGKVVLDAGDGGIDLSGGRIDASGAKGGGAIEIGSWDTASVTSNRHTSLDASARWKGDGGTISVISQNTAFHGTAAARGGSKSGDGGTVETSGHVLDVAHARVSTLARHGATGTWSLDPYNVTISNGTTSHTTGTYTANGNDSVVNVTDLQNALASNNVTISTGTGGSQTGDITVAKDLTWSSSNTLTLDAYHDIKFNASMTITGSGGLALKTGTGGYIIKSGEHVAFTDLVGGVTQGSLSINGQAYTLIGTMTALQNVNNALGSSYALANSLDASSTAGWIPIGTDATSAVLNSQHGFNGTFEGLGNTISNLKVDVGTRSYAGLFGHSMGTIRDLGVVKGSVKGAQYVGGLVGFSFTGSISHAYSSASVSGTGAATNIGGLIGFNDTLVMYSYATGTVSGAHIVGGLAGSSEGMIEFSYATGAVSNSGTYTGGLVGWNSNEISQSYATGAVTGSTYAGGFVGYNENYIEDCYAMGSVKGSGDDAGGFAGFNTNLGSIVTSFSTGAVSGLSSVGGFVGHDDGSVMNSAWDRNTSGLTSDGAYPGAVGATTGALQAALLTGFSSSTWGIVAGQTYPYLKWQVPSGTPQVISGTVLSGAGGTAVASADVSVLVNGAKHTLVSMASGANGYYYELLSPGAIPSSGTPVLIYGLGTTGATLNSNATGSLHSVNIVKNYLIEGTAGGSYAAIAPLLADAIGTYNSVQTIVNGLPNLGLVSIAPTFTIDAAINTPGDVAMDFNWATNIAIDAPITAGGTVGLLTTGGSIAQNSAGVITANNLIAAAKATTDLSKASNVISNLLSGGSLGDAAFSLKDARSLTVTGPVNTGTGDLTLTTKGSHDSITLNGTVSGGTVTLASAAGISGNASGIVNAKTLTGSSYGTVALTAANAVVNLGSFNTNAHNFTLNNSKGLTVSGTVNAGTGSISLTTTGSSGHNLLVNGTLETSGTSSAVTLVSAGNIGESTSTGAVITQLLNVTAKTGISLASPLNDIATIGTQHTDTGSINIVP